MIILEDTRQQAFKHKTKNEYFKTHGIEVRRQALYVGDYTLPTNQSICVDTKKDLQECVMDICGAQHERFRDECIRAKEAGIKLIVLVEEDALDSDGRNLINELRDVRKWRNPRLNIRKKVDGHWVQAYPKATTGLTLMKAMYTMQLRYDVEFQFCRKKDAGRRVLELLGVGDGENSRD